MNEKFLKYLDDQIKEAREELEDLRANDPDWKQWDASICLKIHSLESIKEKYLELHKNENN